MVTSALANLRPPVLTLIPPDSPHGPRVRAAAQAAGAVFQAALPTTPAQTRDRLFVVDTQTLTGPPPAGRRVLLLGSSPGVDCYDIVGLDEMDARLDRAIGNMVERDQLRRRVDEERATVHTLNEIGRALSAHTSQEALLDEVLTHARRVLQADGGSIYLVDGDTLTFTSAQNDTVPFKTSRRVLKLDEGSLAGWVAVNRRPLNIADAYEIPADAPWRPNFSFDQKTGYRTRSMLLVPMNERDGDVLGVIALVNRKAHAGVPLENYDSVSAFSARQAELANSIASQAGLAIENHRLYRDIRSLFDGFVEAAVTAIEARDPTTGGHSHRVADLTTRLALECHNAHSGVFAAARFSQQQLTELHYASMLHDFGKVGVREQVLLKADKLFDWELRDVEARFRVARLQVALESLRDRLSTDSADRRLGALDDDLKTVRRLNKPWSRPTQADIDLLKRIHRTWRLVDEDEPVISTRDIRRLCIPVGSLSPEERVEIESHVTHTYQFLKVIPWTRDLAGVPELAYAHHEKLDGSGYPRGLSGVEIPLGAKLMTITDIFDALTAGDRPYKPAMPVKRAIHILREEADRGKIDADAVELFAETRPWTGIIPIDPSETA